MKLSKLLILLLSKLSSLRVPVLRITQEKQNNLYLIKEKKKEFYSITLLHIKQRILGRARGDALAPEFSVFVMRHNETWHKSSEQNEALVM